MDTLRSLALAALLGGCTVPAETGRADEVRLFYFAGLAQHSDDTIEGADEILGLELVVDADALRSVLVFYVPSLPEDGEQASSNSCGRALWAGDEPRTLAHELGHALGLEHVDDPDNLMDGTTRDGTDLDDEQVDTMRYSAWYLLTQCPIPPNEEE